MKSIFGFCIFLFFCNTSVLADELKNKIHPSATHDYAGPIDVELEALFKSTPEYILLEKPEINIIEDLSGLSAQCPLMQGNYLNLWQAYRTESLQLINLLQQSRGATAEIKGEVLPQLQQLQAHLKSTMTELNRLARPEWNKESLKVLVRWSLPQQVLFDIPEVDPNILDSIASRQMADFLRSKGLLVRPGLPPVALNDLKNMKKRASFVGSDYLVTEAQYMGEASAALIPFFGMDHFFWQVSGSPKNITFEYYKPMTWLEYCQFIQTAEISVRVKFALKNLGGGYAEKSQKFILRSL